MVIKECFRIIVFVLAVAGMYLFFPAVFVLFVPGLVSTYALFRKGEIDRIERIAFSVGLSISFVVLTVMLSNLYLGMPPTRAGVILQVSLLCVFFGLAAAVRGSRLWDVLMLRTGNPKRTLRFIAPVVIVFLLAVNIFYPLVFSRADGVYGGEYARYSDGSFEDMDGLKISRPCRVGFDNGLVFIGYDISQPLRRGKSAHVNYYFRASEDIVVDGVSVVTDFGDDVVFQNQFAFPHTALSKGDIVSLSNDVMIPDDVPAGEYSMSVSLLDGYFPVGADGSDEVGMINVPWYFDELYDRSMDVQFFYNGVNSTAGDAFSGTQRVYIFDEKIAFFGYSMDAGVVSPGQEFEMTYWWKALGSVDVDYTVFVHFIDSKGRVVFQNDHALAGCSSEWSFGDVISEKYDVYVPFGVDEGVYRIRFGLYDVHTGRRVGLSSRNVRGDAPYLAQVTVREKLLLDYYSGGDVRIVGTEELIDSVEVLNPVLVDYGPVVVLGYELDALRCGEGANLTYFVKAGQIHGNYSIRTVITDVDGAGVIGFDVALPLMDDGEVVGVVVVVDVPLDYGVGESLFTFGLRDDDSGEYVRGGRVVRDVVFVGG